MAEDEDKLAKETARAVQADGLLKSDMLNEAFKTLEDQYIAAWRATPHDNITSREKLYLAVNVIGKVRDHLQQVVNNGKLAQAELHKLYADAERKRRFGLI